MRASRRLRALAGLLAVTGLVASACSGSRFHYVNNGKEKIFFKIPQNYGVFNITKTGDDSRPSSAGFETQSIWHVLFDGSAKPTADNVGAEYPKALVGETNVFALNGSDNDGMSQGQARQIVFGFDPLSADPGTPAKFEIVSPVPLRPVDGVTGYRAVVNVPDDPASPKKWKTVDGSSLFDPATHRLYTFTLVCESTCYRQNQRLIDEIASSWKVTQ